ncbi:hypothetical protein ACOI22_09675 [Glaciecola sp. 2405UD65-10]|uniref:hypothetical protein n=1 Tax=Glaciecola sp. 2405UD65-10 TaxID=3397244 RepID=UPI003B5CC4C1
MIKLPKYKINQQNALINAQSNVGSYTNYLKDVLEPAIKSKDWGHLETLEIGFGVTGESLGKVGDNDSWRKLNTFFDPCDYKTETLDFFLDGKIMERNVTNQLKALALIMMWLSPRDYSFSAIVKTVRGLKKFAKALIDDGHNSFEVLSFEQLETWCLSGMTTLDFEREHTYAPLNKLFIEKARLPFSVNLSQSISASSLGLSPNEPKQFTVIPQRLYYIGLQQSEKLVNELYPIRNELGRLSDYIANYNGVVYLGYAKFLASDRARIKNGQIQWYLSTANELDTGRKEAFQKAFLSQTTQSQNSTLELLKKYKPAIKAKYINRFHTKRSLQIGNKVIKGLTQAQSLFKSMCGGCLWALMSRTGMRADEIHHMHTVNGCTTEIISRQKIHIIHADLSKTVRGSQSKQDEFVTTEVGKKAYEILQALHSPLRKRHPKSHSFFHSVKQDCGTLKKKELGRHLSGWFKSITKENLKLTNDDIIDLKVSDPNLSFNIGDEYVFSGHQLRRSFAYYLIGFELCDFPQLKQQFSHISMAMTRHYAKNASKFQKLRRHKQNLAHTIDEERVDQKAQVYLNIFKKLANKERVAGGKGKEFAKNMMKTGNNMFKDRVNADMLSLNYWKKQILEQKRHIHAVAPGIYCTSTGCSLRTQVNLLECVDCKNDYIVDAVFAEAKRKEAEIHMLWDIEQNELTPQTASEAYIKITAAERIMNDLDVSYEPVVLPQEVKELLIPFGVHA